MVQFTELLGHFLKGVVNCSLGFLGSNRDSRSDGHFGNSRRSNHGGEENIFSIVEKEIAYCDCSTKNGTINIIR